MVYNFKSLKNHIYKTSSNGFYVHAPKIKARDIKSTVKYVIRYSGKPAMSQSRILEYDGEYVTFWYDTHEDNQRVEETIHVYAFIKRLIIHIYDKYFNVVRYYGLYAKKHKFSSKFNYMLKSHVAEFRKQLKKIHEFIPTDIVLQMDMTDPGDPSYPPMFYCEKCNGLMKPNYFVGYTGIIYQYDGN